MSVVTWVKRRSRLSKLIDAPGGKSVGAAVRDAVANLEPLREESVRVINGHIDALERMAASDPRPADPDEAVYRLASAVLDAAGPFALHDVSQAAYSLCEIADSHPEGAPFDWRVVDVHVQAMRYLMVLPTDAADARRIVLEGLKQVAEHKGA